MEAPSVKTVVNDEANGIRYEIMAYRPVTSEEALMGIRLYLSSLKKSKRPKRGDVVTIISIIGCMD